MIFPFLGFCSSSHPYLSRRPIRTSFSCKNAVPRDYLLINWKNSRRRSARGLGVLYDVDHRFSHLSLGIKRDFLSLRKLRRMGHLSTLASSDDEITVNGSLQAGTSDGDVENMRAKLNLTLQGEDCNDGLVQSLHDAARVFELAIKECSSSRVSWFTTAWLGVDRNAWVKALSYQVCLVLEARINCEVSIFKLLLCTCEFQIVHFLKGISVFVHLS